MHGLITHCLAVNYLHTVGYAYSVEKPTRCDMVPLLGMCKQALLSNISLHVSPGLPRPRLCIAHIHMMPENLRKHLELGAMSNYACSTLQLYPATIYKAAPVFGAAGRLQLHR